MDNYKIKVKDEAESKEAQELFFELGYRWISVGKNYLRIQNDMTHITAYAEDYTLAMGVGNEAAMEITLSKLKTLVVIKRKNYLDATHIDSEDRFWFIPDAAGKRGYWWTENNWHCSSITKCFRNELIPISRILRLAELLGGNNS